MFTHPDTLYVTRLNQNQDMERHAAQQRLAATAQVSAHPRTFAVRQVAAFWLYEAARRLAGPDFTMRSAVSEERAMSLSKVAA